MTQSEVRTLYRDTLGRPAYAADFIALSNAFAGKSLEDITQEEVSGFLTGSSEYNRRIGTAGFENAFSIPDSELSKPQRDLLNAARGLGVDYIERRELDTWAEAYQQRGEPILLNWKSKLTGDLSYRPATEVGVNARGGSIAYFSPEAMARNQGNVGYGQAEGEVIAVPHGSSVSSDRWQSIGGNNEWDYYQAQGAPAETALSRGTAFVERAGGRALGQVGRTTGIRPLERYGESLSETTAARAGRQYGDVAAAGSAVLAATGVGLPLVPFMDEVAALSGGEAGAQEYNRNFERTVGRATAFALRAGGSQATAEGTSEVLRGAMNVVQSTEVALTVAMLAPITGGAPVLTTANRALQNVAADAQGREDLVSWRTTGRDAAIDWGLFGVGRATTPGSSLSVVGGLSPTAVRSAQVGAQVAARTGAGVWRGQEFDEALTGAVASQAGVLAGVENPVARATLSAGAQTLSNRQLMQAWRERSTRGFAATATTADALLGFSTPGANVQQPQQLQMRAR